MVRERVRSCFAGDTYKYSLPREEVLAVWERLARRYGRPERAAGAGVFTLETPDFLLRAPPWLNPITVLRRRGCRPEALEELHSLLGFVFPAERSR
ncbi:MAG: hypothetical protein D6731_01915 [Planctomycetota bacterium]|nr:MAG: hypothetical protein D6731_01915 [Planctomycetota bacterium]